MKIRYVVLCLLLGTFFGDILLALAIDAVQDLWARIREVVPDAAGGLIDAVQAVAGFLRDLTHAQEARQ